MPATKMKKMKKTWKLNKEGCLSKLRILRERNKKENKKILSSF